MFCRYCGREMAEGASFCRFCGKQQVDKDGKREETTPAEPAGGLTRLDFIVISALVALSLLLILILAVT